MKHFRIFVALVLSVVLALSMIALGEEVKEPQEKAEEIEQFIIGNVDEAAGEAEADLTAPAPSGDAGATDALTADAPEEVPEEQIEEPNEEEPSEEEPSEENPSEEESSEEKSGEEEPGEEEPSEEEPSEEEPSEEEPSEEEPSEEEPEEEEPVEESVEGVADEAAMAALSVENAPVVANALVYTGDAQPLVTAEGEWLYSLDGENFTADIPAAVNAGVYTVYYRAAEDAEAQSVVVTVDKADVVFTPPVPAFGV